MICIILKYINFLIHNNYPQYISYDISYDYFMPHISNKKLNKKIIKELDQYIFSIIHDTSSKTRVDIFKELLTKTEKIMLAKRIGVIFLLRKGLSSYQISNILGISPSTAERFQKNMRSNKYHRSSDWIWKNSNDGAFDAFMESLIRLAFTGRIKSFKQFIDEY